MDKWEDLSIPSYERGYALLKAIYENFSDEDKTWFLNASDGELSLELGRHLRNNARMWETTWTPLLIDGVDHSHDHPDNISGRVIHQFRDNLLRAGTL